MRGIGKMEDGDDTWQHKTDNKGAQAGPTPANAAAQSRLAERVGSGGRMVIKL